MKLRIYKSLWGMTGSTVENLTRVVEAGYDGIEGAVNEITDPKLFKSALKDLGLEYIPLLYSEGRDHLKNLRALISLVEEYQPTKVIAHAGRDMWEFEEQVRFLEDAIILEEEFGIPIAHETHRRRPLYSPMNSLALLKRLPAIKVNADLSHWCCVTESLLEDHAAALEAIAKKSIHIHARVGYENGPQVPDPSAPEWAVHLKKFESWWEQIIDAHRERKEEYLTITPEYGPPSYMQTIPGENKPVVDLWNVCLWSANRFRTFFDEYV